MIIVITIIIIILSTIDKMFKTFISRNTCRVIYKIENIKNYYSNTEEDLNL